jgi:glycosyl transferase family 25
MIRTFIINLARNPERKAFMQQQLDSLGIPHEFIEATDGRNLTKSDTEKIYDKETSLQYLNTPLRESEIGCAHSHARIYRKIVEEHIDYAFILEDDIVLDKRILQIIMPKTLHKETFDWLQINYTPVGLTFFIEWMRASLHYAKKRPRSILYNLLKLPYIAWLCLYEGLRERALHNNPSIVRFSRPLYLAGAYIITQEGAKKLLPLCEPIRFAADMLPNKARILSGLIMRGVSPLLAQQETKTFTSNMI